MIHTKIKRHIVFHLRQQECDGILCGCCSLHKFVPKAFSCLRLFFKITLLMLHSHFISWPKFLFQSYLFFSPRCLVAHYYYFLNGCILILFINDFFLFFYFLFFLLCLLFYLTSFSPFLPLHLYIPKLFTACIFYGRTPPLPYIFH